MSHKLVDAFNSAKQNLFDHVGYEQDGADYAIEDADLYYWEIDWRNIFYSDVKEDVKNISKCYLGYLYYDACYPQSVFRGEDLTMIVVDTRVNNEIRLFVFDNKKEIK
jgi:hypothetical protein